MSRTPEEAVSRPAEALHLAALITAAAGLLLGLLAGRSNWVTMGVSLLLLLPPLRLATTIIEEVRSRRYDVAFMGAIVLAFLLFSRRIS